MELPNKYASGKVYAIKSDSAGLCYVGSTIQSLEYRLQNHISKFTYCLLAPSSRLVVCHPDAYIELLEAFPCSSKAELLEREKFYIKSTECVNIYKNLSRTPQEMRETAKLYRQQNKEKIAQYNKEYGEQHKEAIKAQRKAKGHIITADEAIRKKEWHQQNKERINAIRKERVNCDICGAELSRAGLTRHKKTQHQ